MTSLSRYQFHLSPSAVFHATYLAPSAGFLRVLWSGFLATRFLLIPFAKAVLYPGRSAADWANLPISYLSDRLPMGP